MQSHINVGYGSDITIAQLAKAVGEAVGYLGKIGFDSSKPDGPPRKWMDSGKLNSLGWAPKKLLSDGLKDTYDQFLELGN
jgi:GDP-L-fucose synthase